MEEKMKDLSCHNYLSNDIPSDSQTTNATKTSAKTPGRKKLESWLSKNMKIEMTDGRTLIGIFLCTDQGMNIILGSCSEYLKPDDDGVEDEPRFLGLAMVPGYHIVSIQVDDISPLSSDIL